MTIKEKLTDKNFCLYMENHLPEDINTYLQIMIRGRTTVKVLCYKSEGRWFDPS
jgi:hypothetical protein